MAFKLIKDSTERDTDTTFSASSYSRITGQEPTLAQKRVDRKKKAIERKVSKFKKDGSKSDSRKAKAVGKKMRKIGQLEKGETLVSVDGVKPKI